MGNVKIGDENMIVWTVTETHIDKDGLPKVFDSHSFESESRAWIHFNNRIDRNDGDVLSVESAPEGDIGFGVYKHPYYGIITVEVSYGNLFP